MVEEASKSKTTCTLPGKRIMVAVDGSNSSNSAFFAALRWKKDSDLLLVVFCAPLLNMLAMAGNQGLGGGSSRTFNYQEVLNKCIKKRAQGFIHCYREVCNKLRVPHVRTIVLSSHDIRPRLIQYAQDHGVDVIMIGKPKEAKPSSWIEGMFSCWTFDGFLLNNASCSVAVIKQPFLPMSRKSFHSDMITQAKNPRTSNTKPKNPDHHDKLAVTSADTHEHVAEGHPLLHELLSSANLPAVQRKQYGHYLHVPGQPRIMDSECDTCEKTIHVKKTWTSWAQWEDLL
eukprot:g81808.t1